VRLKVEGFCKGLGTVATPKYLLCPWYSFCPKNTQKYVFKKRISKLRTREFFKV
jgi:hypothetical protein